MILTFFSAGLPKKAQKFFFFAIQPGHVQDFCTSLGKLIPSITTTAKCLNDKKRILQEKKRAAEHHQKPQLLEMSGINIAFSQKGLTAVRVPTSYVAEVPMCVTDTT